MKLLLAVLILSAVACTGCAGSREQRAGALATPTPNEMAERREEWEYLEFIPTVNERLKGTGMKPLRFEKLPPGSRQVRVWAGFALSPVSGIILHQRDGEWFALYIPPLEELSKPALTYQDLVKQLPPPQSGWASFWERLEALGIYTLPDATEVGALNPYLDARVVVVEVKTPDSYRNYLYNGLPTAEAPEAKKMLEIVETLSQEFRISLY